MTLRQILCSLLPLLFRRRLFVCLVCGVRGTLHEYISPEYLSTSVAVGQCTHRVCVCASHRQTASKGVPVDWRIPSQGRCVQDCQCVSSCHDQIHFPPCWRGFSRLVLPQSSLFAKASLLVCIPTILAWSHPLLCSISYSARFGVTFKHLKYFL